MTFLATSSPPPNKTSGVAIKDGKEDRDHISAAPANSAAGGDKCRHPAPVRRLARMVTCGDNDISRRGDVGSGRGDEHDDDRDDERSGAVIKGRDEAINGRGDVIATDVRSDGGGGNYRERGGMSAGRVVDMDRRGGQGQGRGQGVDEDNAYAEDCRRGGGGGGASGRNVNGRRDVMTRDRVRDVSSGRGELKGNDRRDLSDGREDDDVTEDRGRSRGDQEPLEDARGATSPLSPAASATASVEPVKVKASAPHRRSSSPCSEKSGREEDEGHSAGHGEGEKDSEGETPRTLYTPKAVQAIFRLALK